MFAFPKRRYLPISPHGVTTQKTNMRASNLMFLYAVQCYVTTLQNDNPSGYISCKSCPATRHGEAWEERRYSSSFTTSVLDGGEWSASRPDRALPSGKGPPGTHCTGGWVGLRAGLDTQARGKILSPCRGSNPDRPVVQPVVRHYTA
jgi:hypothetical protein